MSCQCYAQLANELAQEELFDAGVEAARNACVAGATLAAAAITASAWYDNPLTGARAVLECMARLRDVGTDLDAWLRAFAPGSHPETADEWSPGFGFVDPAPARVLVTSAARLSACPLAAKLRFFLADADALTRQSGALNVAGLAALVFSDHDCANHEAERRFLLARVDVAMREAARARHFGIARFPFFTESYVYEGSSPPARRSNLAAAMRRVGL